MIEIRKRHPVFGLGTFEELGASNPSVLAYVREFGDDRVLCVANLSRFPQPVELDLRRFAGAVPVEMIGDVHFPRIGELPYLLTMPGHGHYWFALAAPRGSCAPYARSDRPAPGDRPGPELLGGLLDDELPGWYGTGCRTSGGSPARAGRFAACNVAKLTSSSRRPGAPGAPRHWCRLTTPTGGPAQDLTRCCCTVAATKRQTAITASCSGDSSAGLVYDGLHDPAGSRRTASTDLQDGAADRRPAACGRPRARGVARPARRRGAVQHQRHLRRRLHPEGFPPVSAGASTRISRSPGRWPRPAARTSPRRWAGSKVTCRRRAHRRHLGAAADVPAQRHRGLEARPGQRA